MGVELAGEVGFGNGPGARKDSGELELEAGGLSWRREGEFRGV